MIRKNLFPLAVIVIVVVLIAVITYFVRSNAIKEANNDAKKTLFSEDPKAQFLDKQNNPVTLESYKDKVLIVNVWASWSPYTAIEFPILNEIAGAYQDRGVKVLGMNRKESQTQIERYLTSMPNYENIEQIIDVNDFFYNGIDGYAMPETIVFNRDGQIVQHLRGVVKKEELETLLNGILQQE